MSKSYKDFFGNLNKELYESKKQINEISDKEVNLDFIERFSRKIYLNPAHLAKLEMIQYILFIAIIYYYNPLGIETSYPAFTKLLVLSVSFIYVMLFFFIKMKVDEGQDVDLIDPTEKSILIKFISLIAFFVLLMLFIKGMIWILMNTNITTILTNVVTLMLIIGGVAIFYTFFKKSIDKLKDSKNRKFISLFVKFIMFLPCLLIDFTEYVKYEYHLTTRPVWILLGIETLFFALWFLIPLLFDTIVHYNGKKLVNKPLNLNTEYVIAKYDELYELPEHDPYDLTLIDKSYNEKVRNNKIKKDYNRSIYNDPEYKRRKEEEENDDYQEYTDPNVPKNKIMAWIYKKLKNPSLLKIDFGINPQYSESDNYRYRYKYALSGWFYLNPQPPNTNSSYTKYTNIIKYGNKLRVEYNGKKNSLRVMTEVASIDKKKKNDLNIDNNIVDDDDEISKNKSVEVFETNDVIYQKWNNITINYNEGYIDVFLNGVLVGSRSGVAPYMRLDEIITGTNKGLYGGICNVTYYNDVLNEKSIVTTYKALRIQEMPYVWSLNDDISINIERNKNPDNKFLNNMKIMMGIQ